MLSQIDNQGVRERRGKDAANENKPSVQEVRVLKGVR